MEEVGRADKVIMMAGGRGGEVRRGEWKGEKEEEGRDEDGDLEAGEV